MILFLWKVKFDFIHEKEKEIYFEIRGSVKSEKYFRLVIAFCELTVFCVQEICF